MIVSLGIAVLCVSISGSLKSFLILLRGFFADGRSIKAVQRDAYAVSQHVFSV